MANDDTTTSSLGTYEDWQAQKDFYTPEAQEMLYGSPSTDVPDKLKSLEERKAEKLKRLGPNAQRSNLSDSYTVLDNGVLESNKNKIWNDYSDAEFSSLWDYTKSRELGTDDNGNFYKDTGERFEGPVRRAYGFGTKTDDSTYKFGLSRGDRPSSDSRYTDYAVGPDGVDLNKKDHDILIPEYLATAIEGIGHARTRALAGRAVPDTLDVDNYNRFGSGATEYYNSREAFFGDPNSEDYGKAFTPEEAKAVLYRHAALDTTPNKWYKGSYSDRDYLDAYYGHLADESRQAKYDSQGVLDELGQVASAVPAALVKGALDLVDAGQELITWLPQLAARAATGNSKLDIDLFDDGFKKAITDSVDSAVGYNRKLDDITLQRATEEIKAAGIDITSWESLKSAITDPEKRAKLSNAAWLVLTDPSLTVGMITELVGSGGALGTGAKLGAKALAKVAPEAEKAVSAALKSNITKIQEELKVATATGDVARIAALKDSYTLTKQLPDLLKGSVYTNADMMVRMNNDITTFKEHNNGEGPDADKLLSIAVLNRIASSAEVMSLKSLAGIKDIPPKLAQEAVKKNIIKAAGETAGKIAIGGVQEGTQELFDTIVEQLNQKVGSADYENKSITEILQEASAEILVGTIAGAAGGVHVKTASTIPGVATKAIPGAVSLATGLTKGITARYDEATTPQPEDHETARRNLDAAFKNLNVTPDIVTTAPDVLPDFDDDPVVQQSTQAINAAQQEIASMSQQIADLGEQANIASDSGDTQAASVLFDQIDEIKAKRTSLDSEVADVLNLRSDRRAHLNQQQTGTRSNLGASYFAAQGSGNPENIAQAKEQVNKEKAAILDGTSTIFNSDADLDTNTKRIDSAVQAIAAEDPNVSTAGLFDAIIKHLKIENEEQAAQIKQTVESAVASGVEFNRLKTLAEVSDEVTKGPRGFLTYLSAAKTAEAQGDTESHTKAVEQLNYLYNYQTTKIDKLKQGIKSATAIIESHVDNRVKAGDNTNRATELARMANEPRYQGTEGLVINNSDHNNETTKAYYANIIKKLQYPDHSLGIFSIVDTATAEADAMGKALNRLLGTPEAPADVPTSSANTTTTSGNTADTTATPETKPLEALKSEMESLMSKVPGSGIVTQINDRLASGYEFTELTYNNAIKKLKAAIAKKPAPTTTSNTPTAATDTSSSSVNIYYGTGENASLSNLATRRFEYEGRKYLSVEHAYQANKSGVFDEDVNKKYETASNHNKVIRGSKKANIKDNFNLKLMKSLVAASFAQNPDAMAELKATGSSVLSHNNARVDALWAKEFPRILSEVRDEATTSSPTKTPTTNTTFDSLPEYVPGQHTMTYAGIGSRDIPAAVSKSMAAVAANLEKLGYKLQSGGAKAKKGKYSADVSFEAGVKSNKEIFYAEDATDTTRAIAREVHPAPGALKQLPLDLMARNTNQIFGRNLDTPVDFVLVWTPDGAETAADRSRTTGGSGQAIEMAARKGIPVINMANEGWQTRVREILRNAPTAPAPSDVSVSTSPVETTVKGSGPTTDSTSSEDFAIPPANDLGAEQDFDTGEDISIDIEDDVASPPTQAADGPSSFDIPDGGELDYEGLDIDINDDIDISIDDDIDISIDDDIDISIDDYSDIDIDYDSDTDVRKVEDKNDTVQAFSDLNANIKAIKRQIADRLGELRVRGYTKKGIKEDPYLVDLKNKRNELTDTRNTKFANTIKSVVTSRIDSVKAALKGKPFGITVYTKYTASKEAMATAVANGGKKSKTKNNKDIALFIKDPADLFKNMKPTGYTLVTRTADSVKGITKDFAAKLKSLHPTLDPSYSGTVKNDPLSLFVFDKDGEVNYNAVEAIQGAAYEFLTREAPNLLGADRELQDIADVLGLGVDDLSPNIIENLGGGGLTARMVGDAIGNLIIKNLGLEIESVEDREALASSFGMTAIRAMEGDFFEFSVLKDDALDYDVDIIRGWRSMYSDVPVKRADGTDIPTIKNASDLLKSFEEELGVEVSNLRNYRKQPTPGPRDVRQHNNEFQAAPKDQTDTVNRLENTAFSSNSGHEVLFDAYSKDSEKGKVLDKDALRERILGPKDGVTTKDGKDRYAAQALALDNALSAYEDAIADVDKGDIYFNWFIAKQLRIHLDSNGLNPQQDKHLARWLFTTSVSRTDVSKDDVESILAGNGGSQKGMMFVYGIIQAFDGIDGIADIAKDGEAELLESANKLFNMVKGGYSDADLVEMMKSGDLNHVGHAALAISNLRKFHNSLDSVESDMVLEIDGLTNGFAFRSLQYPGEDAAQWHDRVGVVTQDSAYYGIKSMNQARKYKNKDGKELKQDDVYISVGGVFQKHIKDTLGSTKVPESTKVWAKFLVDHKVVEDFNDLSSPSVKSFVRKLMKSPVMIFNYAAGAGKIANGLVEDQVMGTGYLGGKGIIDKLTAVHAKDTANTVKGEFIITKDALVAAFGDKGLVYHEARKKLGGLSLKDKEDPSIGTLHEDLYKAVRGMYVDPLKTTLEELFAEQTAVNVAMINASQFMFNYFKDQYNDWKDSNPNATKEETDEALKAMISIVPGVAAASSDDQITKVSFLKSAFEKTDNEVHTVVQGKHRTTNPISRTFGDPGVAIAVLTILAADSSVLAQTVNEYYNGKEGGALIVHDAAVLGPDESGFIYGYNKKFYTVGKGYSILQEVVDVVAALEKSAGSEVTTKTIKDNAGNTVSFKAMKTKLTNINDVVQARRAELFAKDMDIGQFVAMPGTMYQARPKRDKQAMADHIIAKAEALGNEFNGNAIRRVLGKKGAKEHSKAATIIMNLLEGCK